MKTTKDNMNTANRFLTIIAIAFVASVIFCFPVKWLWNWLVPSIFNLRRISVTEAWGLVLLLQLLLPKSSTVKRGE